MPFVRSASQSLLRAPAAAAWRPARSLILAATIGIAGASEWKLPPLAGEIEGDFKPLQFAAAPTLHWKLTLRAAKAKTRDAQLAVDGLGTKVRATASLDAAAEGAWRITEAEFDLAPWFAAAAAQLGEEFATMSVAGNVSALGEGTWRDGRLGGIAALTLRQGRVDDSVNKLSLQGVALEVFFEDIAELRTAPRQALTWTGGYYDTIKLGSGRLIFSMSGDDVRVQEASLSVLGGELALGAFSFSLRRPEFSVSAHAIGLEVAQLLPLLPPVLAQASGRLDGTVKLTRDAQGIQIGNGHLALREGQSADLRLAPTPGLLSASLPPTVLKYYPGLGKIETGEVPIRAGLLEVTLTPEGDAQGRTASVRVVGGPVDPKFRAPVDLNINVRGPLEWLVRFSTDSRLRFGGGP